MPRQTSSPRVSQALAKAPEDRAIRLMLEATAAKTGEAFYVALAKSIAEILGCAAAWVTEYIARENRLRSLAMWLDGKRGDPYEYFIEGTPCEPVIRTCSVAHFEDAVVDLFPSDPDLPALKAASYIGAPFADSKGRLLGHVAALDRKPMPDREWLRPAMELFAARAGAEYQRDLAEAAVREREQQVSRILESAMDSVLLLDDDLAVKRANPAALVAFDCQEEDLIGERITDYLSPQSAKKFESLLSRIDDEEGPNSKLWIPDGLEAIRWDKKPFPADATVSGYREKGRKRYTLILRNIDERLQAKRRIEQLSRESEYMKSALDQARGDGEIIGQCPAMQRLFEGIERVAQTDATVLVTGETGTGKELVAQSIHRMSLRANRPLVCVNCAAVPESLMESEFFGHERGAFTGATERRLGRFERAEGGTLFLDEIGELPMALQAKLLRVLQEGEFERVGGSRPIKVDTRIVVATHRDLESMVADGNFRRDLYFRLNVFPLSIPSLRERGKDILLLAEAFIERLCFKMGRHFEPLSASEQRLLLDYDWPGNARELQNVIERAIIQSRGRRLLIGQAMPQGAAVLSAVTGTAAGVALRETILTEGQMREFEKRNLERALAACDGAVFGRDGAAALLDIKPTTLTSRIKKFGIARRSAP